jgi:hypothetical protein
VKFFFLFVLLVHFNTFSRHCFPAFIMLFLQSHEKRLIVVSLCIFYEVLHTLLYVVLPNISFDFHTSSVVLLLFRGGHNNFGVKNVEYNFSLMFSALSFHCILHRRAVELYTSVIFLIVFMDCIRLEICTCYC